MKTSALVLAALLGLTSGQQPGTAKKNYHPELNLKTCYKDGGCTVEQKKVTLDANWRWIHGVNSYANCYEGDSWSNQFCPDNDSCAKNCQVEGVEQKEWESIYGITTDGGNSLNLKLKQGNNVGSRSYMMASNTEYEMFNLLNQEFTITVDVSNLPCGVNGALYFVSMDNTGNMEGNNKAGAAYGTGYCDAQCPHDIKFIKGSANSDGWTKGQGKDGTCCPEMDIWEANKISSAYTTHACKSPSLVRCTDDTTCGADNHRYEGECDKDGCDLNSYRANQMDFFGEGKTVDTSAPMSVVTQFLVDAAGDLTEIRRKFIQNGKITNQVSTNLPGLHDVQYDSIKDDMCQNTKNEYGDVDDFTNKGGMKGMGEGMKNGMVLVMSLWVDYAAHMLWLDSTYPTDKTTPGSGGPRGTCPTTSGDPALVINQFPNSSVKYSDIRVGDIDSTYGDLLYEAEEFLQ